MRFFFGIFHLLFLEISWIAINFWFIPTFLNEINHIPCGISGETSTLQRIWHHLNFVLHFFFIWWPFLNFALKSIYIAFYSAFFCNAIFRVTIADWFFKILFVRFKDYSFGNLGLSSSWFAFFFLFLLFAFSLRSLVIVFSKRFSCFSVCWC